MKTMQAEKINLGVDFIKVLKYYQSLGVHIDVFYGKKHKYCAKVDDFIVSSEGLKSLKTEIIKRASNIAYGLLKEFVLEAEKNAATMPDIVWYVVKMGNRLSVVSHKFFEERAEEIKERRDPNSEKFKGIQDVKKYYNTSQRLLFGVPVKINGQDIVFPEGKNPMDYGK